VREGDSDVGIEKKNKARVYAYVYTTSAADTVDAAVVGPKKERNNEAPGVLWRAFKCLNKRVIIFL
jgi:hypothetical protein